ncbi:hypothetical protein [Nocardioides convexus]|uniref:hypothetical protein n=1 Tax=Nocardioides convexus TaxID=2712224 RepID=UPI0024183E3A|nr:hypothetical protein [Nocardioides convexus]
MARADPRRRVRAYGARCVPRSPPRPARPWAGSGAARFRPTTSSTRPCGTGWRSCWRDGRRSLDLPGPVAAEPGRAARRGPSYGDGADRHDPPARRPAGRHRPPRAQGSCARGADHRGPDRPRQRRRGPPRRPDGRGTRAGPPAHRGLDLPGGQHRGPGVLELAAPACATATSSPSPAATRSWTCTGAWTPPRTAHRASPSLWSRRAYADLGPVTVATLAPADALHQALRHSARDGWDTLRSLVDVHRLARDPRAWPARPDRLDRASLSVVAATTGLPPGTPGFRTTRAGLPRALSLQAREINARRHPGDQVGRYVTWALAASHSPRDLVATAITALLPRSRLAEVAEPTAARAIAVGLGRRARRTVGRLGEPAMTSRARAYLAAAADACGPRALLLFQAHPARERGAGGGGAAAARAAGAGARRRRCGRPATAAPGGGRPARGRRAAGRGPAAGRLRVADGGPGHEHPDAHRGPGPARRAGRACCTPSGPSSPGSARATSSRRRRPRWSASRRHSRCCCTRR